MGLVHTQLRRDRVPPAWRTSSSAGSLRRHRCLRPAHVLRPQRGEIPGQGVAHLAHLALGHMVGHGAEHHLHRLLDIDRTGVPQGLADVVEELLARTQLQRPVPRRPLVIIGAANEDRQLRSRCAARGVGTRSRKARSTAPRTCQASCRSGPRSAMISSSQMFVVCRVLSKTSSPAALILASLSIAGKTPGAKSGSSLSRRPRSVSRAVSPFTRKQPPGVFMSWAAVLRLLL
jgi:hypothetical protein